MKILLLNDGSKYENWGIRACFDGLTDLIKMAIPSVELITMPHDEIHKRYRWEPKIHTTKFFSGEGPFEKRLRKELLPVPKFADDFDRAWNQALKGKYARKLFDVIESVDAVIFNGEGSTYRNNYGASKCLFLLWLAKKKFKKRAYFVNGSITISDVDNTLEGFVDRALSCADGIVVREPMSKDQLNAKIPHLNVKCAPDSVYAIRSLLCPGKGSLEEVAFSPSMLPMDFRTDLKSSKLPSLLTALKKGGSLSLLAKDIEDQDIKLLQSVVGGTMIGPQYTYVDVANYLGEVQLLFSGRYHHLIFALMRGTPVLPLNTSSHKIKGLVQWYNKLLPVPIDPTYLKNDISEQDKQKIYCSGGVDRDLIYERSVELAELCQTTYRNLLQL